MTCREAYEIAEKLDAELRADNPIFRNSVRIIHEEGTVLNFEWASVVRLSQDYVGIFTEHHGFHVYHYEDLYDIIQYKRLDKTFYSVEEVRAMNSKE